MDLKNELTKLFAIGSAKERKSIYLHKPIIDAIELIADRTGKDFSELVALFLDKQLTDLVHLGYLEAPKVSDDKPKTPDLKSVKAEGA